MSIDHARLAPTWGAVVTGSGALADLDSSEVLDLFRRAGAICFRGFSATDSEFGDFSARFCSSFLGPVHAGQSREVASDAGRTMTVDLGNRLVGHHSELGYSPLRPDVLWFHCVSPAAAGGETLLCDGVAVIEELPEDLRDAFTRERVRYVLRGADAEVWPLFSGGRYERAETLERLAAVPGVEARPAGGTALDIEYTTSAIAQGPYGGCGAFANSVIVSGEDAAEAVFESGTPIDRGMRLKLLAACTKAGISLRLEAGDVAMIDNWRVMHGRAGFTGERRVHVRMGTLARPDTRAERGATR